ncbi:hypothetical protein [Superficieibacter sp. HKU1]|uniref:hypothetical protein n=1 Tax=Superficieibacter sp. HKU1 TaxID=3031919 RepID=UPI0023E0999B|nr:hypothetical protein [Superficieibacter sp. HKU1]WES66819.1 hypothetical protein P0H77_14315 [Superficieibacter sp. HKU1]
MRMMPGGGFALPGLGEIASQHRSSGAIGQYHHTVGPVSAAPPGKVAHSPRHNHAG